MKVVKFHLIITLIYNFSLGCYVGNNSQSVERVNMPRYSFLAFMNLKLNAGTNLCGFRINVLLSSVLLKQAFCNLYCNFDLVCLFS